jgi:hydroxymethylpyrimidine pyrophosphatase-like HAD family hydrolase
MIKGLILDIDGVLVGEKIGYNSPFPHPDVLERIRKIHSGGTPVTLCTGKPAYAIGKIVIDCGLDNPHISDGGAIISDPITGTIIQKHVIDPTLVTQLLETCFAAGIYVEVYTPDRYIIQKDQFRENLTPIHTIVLQTPPRMVADLTKETLRHEVIKVMPVARDEKEKQKLIELFAPFADRAVMSLGVHPIANPHWFGLVTTKGISKRESALEAMNALKIDIADCLGVGDSTSDWQFMELCGYAATVGNGTTELKNHISEKKNQGYVTDKSVDDNGILDILTHFSLG